MFGIRKIKIVISTLILCELIFLGLIFYSQGESGRLRVIFLDVGQGDAILVKSPYGQKVLIDGGPDRVILAKLGEWLPFYDKEIDLVVSTHPHADHVSGLVEVLKKYDVEQVLMTGVMHTSRVYEEFLRLIKAEHVPVAIAARECESLEQVGCDFQEVVLGPDLKMEILWPIKSLQAGNLNNSSIVVKLKYDDDSFLLTGDIEEEVEEELVRMVETRLIAFLQADVLKVAHQGADTSSSENFLRAVQAKYAIISVGENSYGHPSRRVIGRLERMGTRVLRTDMGGDVECVSNKKYIECF